MTYITRKLKNTSSKTETNTNKLNMNFSIKPVVRVNTPNSIRTIPSNPSAIHAKSPIYDQYTGVILSLATTMSRVEPFFTIIDSIDSIDRVYKVIIHLCKVYKRFKLEVSDQDLNAVKQHPIILRMNAKHGYEKYVVHIVDDWGPITKLTGVYQYTTQHKYVESKIVIMDDDTEYLDNCLTELVHYKTPNNIIAGSGFRFYEKREYTIIDETGNKKGKLNRADVVEGFSGICFQYSDLDPKLMQFIRYYRTIDWDVKVDESNEYNYRVNTLLKACFLGDDFVISYYFGKKKQLYKVFGYIDSIKQQGYGYGADALHQNTVFQSNNGSYAYILKNIHIFELLLIRIDLCAHIRQLGPFVIKKKLYKRIKPV